MEEWRHVVKGGVDVTVLGFRSRVLALGRKFRYRRSGDYTRLQSYAVFRSIRLNERRPRDHLA